MGCGGSSCEACAEKSVESSREEVRKEEEACKARSEEGIESSREEIRKEEGEEEEDRRWKEELARMAPDDRARHILRSGGLRLLSANWLLAQGDRFILRRMQDLPPEAFLSPEKAAEMYNVKWAVIVVSYGWLSKAHPDPRGFHMRNVQKYLRKHKKNVTWLQEYGVFWDFASLPQDGPKAKKTAEEKRMFKKGLGAINLLYGAQFTIVIQLTVMPSAGEMAAYGADGNSTPYLSRGWCFFEATVSALIKDSFYLMDIGFASGPLGDPNGEWRHFQKTAICNRLPPLVPSEMATELRSRKFTNGADMEMVIQKYDEFFQECAQNTAELYFNNNSKGKGWNDDQVRRCARIVPHFQGLTGLSLGTHKIMGEPALADVRRAIAGLQRLNHLIIPKHLETTKEGKALKDEWLKAGRKMIHSSKEKGGLLFN